MLEGQGSLGGPVWPLESVKGGTGNHLIVQVHSETRIDAAVEKEGEGHQMNADRLNGARILVTGVLGGVGVDDDLVKPHALRVEALDRQKLTVASPARCGAEHVRVGGSGLPR